MARLSMPGTARAVLFTWNTCAHSGGFIDKVMMGVKLHSGFANGHRLERAWNQQVARFCGSGNLDVGGGHCQRQATPHNLKRDGGLKRGSTG
jgi:hypothetical protein